MKIAKALKEKNKLAKELKSLHVKLSKNISHKKEVQPDYNANELMLQIEEKTNQLIAIKTAIQVANSPVHNKIFRLGELKSRAQLYKELKILKGTESSGGWGSTATVEYQSQISQKQLDEIVASIELEIEALQDELDYFNATTEI